jgi:hypothetical protein
MISRVSSLWRPAMVHPHVQHTKLEGYWLVSMLRSSGHHQNMDQRGEHTPRAANWFYSQPN